MRRLPVFLVVALLLPSVILASARVTSVEIMPSSPVRGDVLTVDVVAGPGERVDVQVRFRKDLPVRDGSYLLELRGVEIPQTPNSFTVKASNVKNLVVAVKLLFWIPLSRDAVNGVATLSQSDTPPGTYDIRIRGDAAAGAGEVAVEVTAQTTVEMDGEGRYRITYDTSAIPAGAFRVDVGGVSKTVTLLEEGAAPPPVVELVPPRAAFDLPGEAYVGRPLVFDASRSSDADGVIVEYSWDMGDGATHSGGTVTHTYLEPGGYTVALTVRDNHGLTGTRVELLQVHVAPNAAPVPVLSTSRRCYVGQPVGFSAHGSYDPDGHIVAFRWGLGDGSEAEGAAVKHRYMSPGRYNVTLVVTDDGGSSSEAVVQVTVLERPGSSGWFEAAVEDGGVVNVPGMGLSLRVNVTEAVDVLVFRYLDDPHPGYAKPPGHLEPIVDVSVGDPDLVRWPLRVELRYNGSRVSPGDEGRLGLYHFHEGWTQCRETGVDLEGGYVWARLHEDELGGSPLTVGFKSSVEGVTLRNLLLSAEEVEPGGEVEVTVDVVSVAGEASRYTLVLEVDGAPHSVRTVYLEPGEGRLVTWTLSLKSPGDYRVKVGDLVRVVRVAGDALPDLEVSAVLPAEAVAGRELTMNVTVWNRGGSEAPAFSVRVYCGGLEVGSRRLGPLQAGGVLESVFSWAPVKAGEYPVRVVVDEEGSVEESCKENNEYVAAVTVAEPGVDLHRGVAAVLLVVVVAIFVLIPLYVLRTLRPSPAPQA